MRLLFSALLAVFITAPLLAQPLNGFSFSHKDWEVSCDNTGTCRAAGYGGNAVSVLLTRAAGPDTQVKIEVTFAQRTENESSLSSATLLIDCQKEGTLTKSSEGYFTLNNGLQSAFLTALRQDNIIEFEADGQRQSLSTAGSNAVLLKMDAFQKRINTRSALLHPGEKNNNDVLQAKPAPLLITSDASAYENGEIFPFSGPVQIWGWDGKNFTLRDEYRSGGQDLSINGAWTLPTFVSNVRTQRDVDADNVALKALHRAVNEKTKSAPDFNLSKIVEQFPLAGNITDFTISYIEDSPLPDTKPSPEISDDEWQAFSRSSISVESENGHVNFTLIDLDGDGKRDLIIDSYMGGTGLFSYTGVLKRGEDKFFSTNKNVDGDDFGVPGALFSENGRGANQWGQWVRINGQIYALWFNGLYGEDNLYLLRPFSTGENVPFVTVRYRYKYDKDSIQPQEGDGLPLKPKFNKHDKDQLVESLNRMQDDNLQMRQQTTPICPVPQGTPQEDAESYSLGIAGTYVSQHVADVPVWIDGVCFIGSIESYFGRGENLDIASPKEHEIIGSYEVTGLRNTVSVKSGWKPREGENGVW